MRLAGEVEVRGGMARPPVDKSSAIIGNRIIKNHSLIEYLKARCKIFRSYRKACRRMGPGAVGKTEHGRGELLQGI
jgi:hypothetical protein